MNNSITIDVEEYFHPSEVQAGLDPAQWSVLPTRVEEPTLRIADLLARYGTRGTFFILGWVAEKHPALVRRIAEAGHEIGCHSYAHQLVYDLTPDEFRADTMRAQKAIADACGCQPRVYRAPSFSIVQRSLWALEILVECGFTMDSSIFPIAHDRYGIPGFGRHAVRMDTPAGPITEVPVATVRLSGTRIAPVGGGGYLRLLPYRYTAAGVRRINRDENQPACLYLHPWEVDPEQPRLAKGRIASLRTYAGLSSMFGKLESLLKEFSFAPMSEVYAGLATHP